VLLKHEKWNLVADRSAYARPAVLDVVGVQQARREELQKLLETAAFFAEKWYGARCLVVDRTATRETADIRAYLADGQLVDLWDLNFVLWDEAHWAATRLVPEHGVVLVRPYLHRD
jgi:hypothetical protein